MTQAVHTLRDILKYFLNVRLVSAPLQWQQWLSETPYNSDTSAFDLTSYSSPHNLHCSQWGRAVLTQPWLHSQVYL